MVSDKRNELGVCGFSACGVHGVGEYPCQHVNIASVPCYLDSVADSALNSRRGRLIALCNGGIEQLCDAVYHLIVVYRQHDSGAQIVIALDVSGDSDLMYYLGDSTF